MSDNTRTSESKAPAGRRKPAPAPQATGPEQATLEQMPVELVWTVAPDAETQRRRLADRRLPVVQRQRLAQQIGQRHGNGHLQELLSYRSSPAHPAPVVPAPTSGQPSSTPLVSVDGGPAVRTGADRVHAVQAEEAEETDQSEPELSWWERAKMWAFKKALGVAGVEPG